MGRAVIRLQTFSKDDGKTTIALARFYPFSRITGDEMERPTVEAQGTSTRSDEDQPDKRIGNMLAAGRALIKMGRHLHNKAWEIIRAKEELDRIQKEQPLTPEERTAISVEVVNQIEAALDSWKPGATLRIEITPRA